MSNFKNILLNNPKLCAPACKIINFLNVRNRVKAGNSNQISYKVAFFQNTKIEIHGKGNTIIIEDYSILKNCYFYIHGDNNTIHIGQKCSFNGAEFWIENSQNQILIGNHTSIHGKTHLAAIESTEIVIGEDCMFSSDIQFRTGDSHSIVNLQGERINPSQNITIGDHCWIGTKVICLKGTEVAHNSIIGAGTLLSGKYQTPNCALVGVPAKVIKEDVDWRRERI